MATVESPASQQTKGNWKQFKGRLQQAWGDLTDNDLDRFEGKQTELEGWLEERTGEARQSVRDKLSLFARELNYKW